jgi:FtsP/CotA-like multicopper oxidase with cupredoxin domain
MKKLSRREALKRGLWGAAALASAPSTNKASTVGVHTDPHAVMTGGVPQAAGIDPTVFLTAFDFGEVSRRSNGQRVREYRLTAIDRKIEVIPGLFYDAWTFNGQVPGPTLRATEGDLVRVHFTNAGLHEHSVHFHGFHAADMDGVFEQIPPGGSYVYEFEAGPFGLHLYHCHTMPLKRHIAKGLYGAFVIDPRTPRPPAREMVMVMNGFDVNYDAENEVYAVNTVPFAYQAQPIALRRGELNRIYLVNVLEFDLLNSIHIHANFFHVFRTGTSVVPSDYTDTISMAQGERHILEFTYDRPGKFMFHAHQSEFAELGWMGLFDVREGGVTA